MFSSVLADVFWSKPSKQIYVVNNDSEWKLSDDDVPEDVGSF